MKSSEANPIINTHIRSIITRFSEGGIELKTVEGHPTQSGMASEFLPKGIIGFYFCTRGSAELIFGTHYSRPINDLSVLFFYNPDQDLKFDINMVALFRLVILLIPIEGLHKLFVHEPHGLPILHEENRNRKFYDERSIPPQITIVLNQLFTVQLGESVEALFYKAKAFEILSLYFSSKTPDTENCPFLRDEEAVRKIKHAKDHLLRNLTDPPTLKSLAKIIGLNEYQLKVGFREVYGITVFGFVLDHKLDQARILLDKGQQHVNEVAFQIGYTNPSHFIAAFKKKFGMTPKKYMMHHAPKRTY